MDRVPTMLRHLDIPTFDYSIVFVNADHEKSMYRGADAEKRPQMMSIPRASSHF